MAQGLQLSPRHSVAALRLPLPSDASENAPQGRRTTFSIDKVTTRPEIMGSARTRRGSIMDRRLVGERTESPERIERSMRRRLTKGKSKMLAATVDFRTGARGRVASFMEAFAEDDDLRSARRPSSLPGGLGGLESQGSGLGYFKDRLKDLETAIQPELRNRAYTEDLRRDLLNLTDFAETKDMGEAVKEGYITEDFSRLIFDKFKNVQEPEFLQDINLEACGGLSMVKEIPLKEKYFWFVVLVVSVIFNVAYLLHLDWTIFETYFLEVFGTLDWRIIVDRLSNGGGSESKSKIQAELLDDANFKASIFGLISDHQTRMLIVNSAVMVATWEVVWLFIQFVHGFYLLLVMFCDTSEYKRFHALGYCLQRLLPQVSTFSAVKLLARVHPSLISHEYRLWLAESSEKLLFGHRRNTCGYAVLTITFVLFNICCAAASVSAFSVKMLVVSFKLVNQDVSVWLRLASILATLNQVVGAVYLERVLQDRIFLFVFGGRDANYEDDELAYRNAYETRLIKEIWVQYWDQGNGATGWRTWPQKICNGFKAVVLLSTLDHIDLQYLMVEDPEEAIDLFERLGLVETAGTGSSSKDALQRSLSAPDDLSPSKRATSKEATRKELSTCERLWATLNCRNVEPRGPSSEKLGTLEEEAGEDLSPSRVNSPLAESEVNVGGYRALSQDQNAQPQDDTAREPASSPEPPAPQSVPPVEEAVSRDALGPVCSEQEHQSCNATESAVTDQNTLVQKEEIEQEASQPLLPAPPEEDFEGGSAVGSAGSVGSLQSQRSGMEGLARLFRKERIDYWGDSELSLCGAPRSRSRHLAWGDGFSEGVVSSLPRSETKESFDWEAMFSPEADEMV